jgi:altronate hydrolase
MKRGLVFMDTPGFDPISVTGMVAAGCHLVAFTTGRGSVYGCSIAPTIKISSHSDLYTKLKDDIDIDAGKILSGGDLIDVGEEIYSFFIKAASGAKTLSEQKGLGKEEFVPWQLGENL